VVCRRPISEFSSTWHHLRLALYSGLRSRLSDTCCHLLYKQGFLLACSNWIEIAALLVCPLASVAQILFHPNFDRATSTQNVLFSAEFKKIICLEKYKVDPKNLKYSTFQNDFYFFFNYNIINFNIHFSQLSFKNFLKKFV
jgi:hypothetical protein